MAQTRFKLMDVGFWSDESHWEAIVTSASNDTEVIGTVRQNISSFNSKWYLGANLITFRLFLVIFCLVKGPQIISMSNTKCGWFFFPIKKEILGRSSQKKPRSHLFFFRKAFKTTGEKQEKKHITQKSSQCPIHWGP